MRVEQLGSGDPTVAIIGAIHGDEPCGVRAIERLLAEGPTVEAPVKLIVANELALERGVRYVDTDLNRAFGVEVAAGAHERGVAERLAAEVEGCTVLAIHSTQSHPEPFGLVQGIDDRPAEIASRLSIEALVDIESRGNGRIFALDAEFVEVEAGYQRSEAAAENAYRLSREFLTATGVLPGRTVPRDLPVFRLGEAVPKPAGERYEVLVENFTRVGAGDPFATADGDTLYAETAFYPVLMSAYGYEDIFGYAGERTGRLRVRDAGRADP